MTAYLDYFRIRLVQLKDESVGRKRGVYISLLEV